MEEKESELIVEPEPLSAKYKESFAYPTIKDRLPVILTQVIDFVHRKRKQLVIMGIVNEKDKRAAEEETKEVIGRLAKLRNELQTDKPVIELESSSGDVQIWNNCLKQYRERHGKEPLWYDAPWLYVECYLYRRIRETFELSKYIVAFDPFQEQKQDSLKTSIDSISALALYLDSLSTRDYCIETEFIKFIELSLWGNKCDLSMSCGKQTTQSLNILNDLAHLRSKVVANDSAKLWKYFKQLSSSKSSLNLSIVLDNAGFELFTDLCLIEYLYMSGLLNNNSIVKFYVKTMPWFVSDTMAKDFHWTLQYLSIKDNTQSTHLTQLSTKWKKNIVNGLWIIVEHQFWTLPHDYSQMKSVAPDLYKDLEDADLIIFKGDLNYRKIVGDLNWNVKVPLLTALRGFLPSSLCTLRTIKADVVVGIHDNDVLKQIEDKTIVENWNISGDYAVIQFIEK